MLHELREGEAASKKAFNKLTDYEMRELTAKVGTLPHQGSQGFENGAATDSMTD